MIPDKCPDTTAGRVVDRKPYERVAAEANVRPQRACERIRSKRKLREWMRDSRVQSPWARSLSWRTRVLAVGPERGDYAPIRGLVVISSSIGGAENAD